MKKEDIALFLTADPFLPFKIRLSDGRAFSIEHPDQVLVTAHKIIVGIGYKGPFTVDSEVHCPLLHITQIEASATPA